MEITGKIIHVLEEKSGEGKNGTWVSQSWVLETQEQYPKKICFEAFNKHFTIKEGDEIVASINLESREWEGKWFTKASAWKVDFLNKTDRSADPVPENSEAADAVGDGDIPF